MTILIKFYFAYLRIILNFLYFIDSVMNLCFSIIEFFVQPFFKIKGDFRFFCVSFRDDFLNYILKYNQYINEKQLDFENNLNK